MPSVALLPAPAAQLTVRCYACHGVGAVDAEGPLDPLADRDAWPEVPCVFTPDCPGAVVPEALN